MAHEEKLESLTLDELSQALREVNTKLDNWYPAHIEAHPEDAGKLATRYDGPHTYGPDEFPLPDEVAQWFDERSALLSRWIDADLKRMEQEKQSF